LNLRGRLPGHRTRRTWRSCVDLHQRGGMSTILLGVDPARGLPRDVRGLSFGRICGAGEPSRPWRQQTRRMSSTGQPPQAAGFWGWMMLSAPRCSRKRVDRSSPAVSSCSAGDHPRLGSRQGQHWKRAGCGPAEKRSPSQLWAQWLRVAFRSRASQPCGPAGGKRGRMVRGRRGQPWPASTLVSVWLADVLKAEGRKSWRLPNGTPTGTPETTWRKK